MTCPTRRGALLLLCLLGLASAALGADHPNILFIAIDDLNDWTGPLGGFGDVIASPQLRRLATPHLDRLAHLGVTFSNAQTAAPACNPSRAALLLGISPATSGLITNDNGRFFREYETLRHATSLPQHLKRPDGRNVLYTIKTTGKIWHRSWQNDSPGTAPTPRAFTEWDEAPANDSVSLPPGLAIDGTAIEPNPWDLGTIVWRKRTPTYRGQPVTDPLLLQAFSDAQSDQQKAIWAAEEVRHSPPGAGPRFLAVGIFRPHLPWDVPVQFFDRFPLDAITIPVVDGHDLDDIYGGRLGLTGDHAKILEHGSDPDRPGEENLAWRLAIQAYLAAVAYADDAVGKMLDAVEEKNRDEDPDNDWTIVLWSDHGWHLGEKERWRKFTLWEESARSLLMIWQPGTTRPGSAIRTPVDFLDIFPTVVDLAGLEPLPQLQGRSLRRLLADPSAREDGFAVTSYSDYNHSVRSRRWRYIRYVDGRQELYDHFQDPREHINLLHADNVERLRDLRLSAERIETVRRVHSTALFEWLIQVHSRSIYDGTTPLEELSTLGNRTIERFDGSGLLSDRGWTLRQGGGDDRDEDFGLAAGRATAAAGVRMVSTRNGSVLGAGEDFLAAVSVEMSGDTAGLGLLFGYVDDEDFYELQLVNQDASAADGSMDLRLLRQGGAGAELLLRFDELRRLGDGSTSPLDFEQGLYTLVAAYTAEDRSLELLVQDGLGLNLFRERLVLEEAVPRASRFGISSWAAAGESGFDDFVVLTHAPVETAGPLLELTTDRLEVRESAGNVTLSVHRSGDGRGEASVQVVAEEGTAWAGQDFDAVTATLRWADGELAERSFVVPIHDDATVETDETLQLRLRSPSGDVHLGAPVTARVTIVDDDSAPNACAPEGETLCLLENRFAVEVQWQDGARAGPCRAVPLTGQTGYCWFFRPGNVELVLKVLDGCGTSFHSYWVFAAGLTDLETRIRVVDSTTRKMRQYHNPSGVPFQPINDTAAFLTCP